MALQSQCPHCGKVLTLKSEAAFGKKARCPGCSEPFLVKPMKKKSAPAKDEWEEDDWQEEEDTSYSSCEDEEEDDEEQPVRKAASRGRSGGSASRGGKNSKKKKRASAGMPDWIKPVAIGLVALLVVGGGGFGVFKLLSGMSFGSNPIDLAWMPDNGDMYGQVKFKEINNAPIVSQVKQQLQQNPLIQNLMNQSDNLPWKLDEVDKLTMCGVDMVNIIQRRQNLFGGSTGPDRVIKQANQRTMGVLRLTRAMTEDEIAAKLGTKTDLNGKGLFRNAMNGQSYCLVEPQTILFGDDSLVREAVARGPKAPRVSRIDFMSGAHHVAFVMAPPAVVPEQVNGTAVTPEAKFEESVRKGAKYGSIGVSFTSDVEMEVRLQCFKSGDAGDIKTNLDVLLTDTKSKMDAQFASAPPQAQEFVSIAKETMQSLATSQSGSMVKVSGKVPGRIATAIQSAMSNPLAMMAMGGAMQPPQMPAMPQQPGSFGAQPPGFTQPMDPNDQAIAAIQQDQQSALNQLNQVRGQIRGSTGAIGQAVPGGFTGKPLRAEVPITAYSGQGDWGVATRQILATIPAVDQSSIQYNPATKLLTFKVMGSSVEAAAALARGGFLLGEMRMIAE